MDVNVSELAVWQKWILVLGKSALTLLITYQMAVVSWMVIAPAPVMLKAPSKGQQNRPTAAVSGTARHHLFGIASSKPAPKPKPQQVDAPVTRLRLSLLGVTESSSPEYSSAIIAQQGREGEFFRVGDTVQGRTLLQAVYQDRVMLDTSGKLEVLKFDEVKNSGVSAQAVSRRPSRPSKGNSASRGSLKDRFSRVRSASEAVDVVTSEVSSDPLKALNRMGLEPQGSGSGYRVSARSPLRQFQLKPGDVVLSLNGQSLGDPASDQSLLADLDSADEVRIEVQRGNRRFTVNHRLD